MINNITIKNFKSIKNTTMVTQPLNLLMGLNGMGKSSFIQSLLLLKQSQNELYDRTLVLNGDYSTIGKGKDALYQFASEEAISFSLNISGKIYNWDFKYEPDADKLQAVLGYHKGDIDAFNDYFNLFQYLTTERVGPMDLYDMQKSAAANFMLGEHGEFTAHFLHLYGNKLQLTDRLRNDNANGLTLMNLVNGWLQSISPGVSLKVIEVPHIDKLVLSYEFALKNGNTNGFRPKNVGFGISYVLPIITTLLLPKSDKIIIIENPETHIHPRGQAELGKLIALSASLGSQLFIETHSDHILNGIRVAVKDGLISSHDVNISYFDKETTESEQYSRITQIKVDKYGELSDYPKDFMDEWNNQLLKLI